MKRFFYYTLFLLCYQSLVCGAQVGDSTLYQLLQLPNDTERVNQIYQQGFNLRNADIELAFQYATVCEQEAKKSDSKKHIAKSYNLLGVLFFKKSDYESAIIYQTKALKINQAIYYATGCGINQINLGNIYAELTYYNQAESYYLQALKTYNALNNKLQLTRCLINIGALKNNQKQFDAAKHQYQQALMYAQQLNDIELVSDCYNNIGVNCISEKQLDSAEIYLQEGLKLREQMDDDLEKINSYNNLAHLYIEIKEFDKAKNYLKLSETLCTQQDFAEGKVELYSNYSFWHEAQKQYEQAFRYKKMQIQLRDSIQLLDKENNQLMLLNNTIEDSTKSATNNSIWLYGMIAFLIVIIIFLGIKLKHKS